ncbi:MAG: hypothetical protein AAFV53_29670 [Myxococcota bacterium]
MGADITNSVLQGLVVADPRFGAATISADSTAQQAGPIPGDPVAQRDTDTVLYAVGEMAADTNLRLQVVRSGHPRPGGGALVWRNEGDTLWHGWDPPYVLTGFEWIDRSTIANKYQTPHGLALPNGNLVIVSQDGDQRVTCWIRDASTGAWSSSLVFLQDTAYVNVQPNPCLVRLPSGRLLCYFWIEIAQTSAILQMRYSDDGGVNWSLGQERCTTAGWPLGATVPSRLRGAYLNGDVVLFFTLTRNSVGQDLFQYASEDLGANFVIVDALNDDNPRVAHDVAVIDGQIVLAYVGHRSGSPADVPYARILGSAFEQVSTIDPAIAANPGTMLWGEYNNASSRFDEADLAIWADEDDNLYIVGTNWNTTDGDYELHLIRSDNSGQTWSTVGQSSKGTEGAAVWYGRDNDGICPRNYCAIPWRGRVALIANHFQHQAGGLADDSLHLLWLGGWTTVCTPAYTSTTEDLSNRVSWEHTWVPYDLPHNVGPTWTLFNSGATLLTSSSGAQIQHTTASQSALWSTTIGTGLSTGAIDLTEVRVSGGLTAFIRIRISSGSVDYDAEVRVTGTSLSVIDNNSGALISSTPTTAATTGVQILASCDGDTLTGRLQIWWRPTSVKNSNRPFTQLALSAGLVSGGVTSAVVQFGTIAGATGSAFWMLQCLTKGVYTGRQLTVFANPDDLLGRTLSVTPFYTHAGLSVFAADGPAVRGDGWSIDTDYTYSLAHIDPLRHRSPARVWRSLDDDTEQEIIFEPGDLLDIHGLESAVQGLYLGRINFRTASFWGETSSGVWEKIADLDSASGASALGFTRSGAVIVPRTNAGTSADRWFTEQTLTGSYWQASAGATPRKIRSNRGGAWIRSTVGTSLLTRLVLEGAEPTDTSLGSVGAILHRELLALVSVGDSMAYRRYKLVIPAQPTAEGFFEMGVLMVGPFISFGHPYAIGRAFGDDFQYELTEGRNGNRVVRETAAPRGFVEFDWTDGVYTGPIAVTNPHPDYRRDYTGGSIIAAPAATPFTARGVLRRLGGMVEPCVYVAQFKIGEAAGTQLINNPDLFLYGAVVGESSRLDVAEGNEWDPKRGEMIRVNTVRVEGEL